MRALLRIVVACCALSSIASADGTGREAARHFQRGVELYNDGDFRGALVEFKRAYKLLPRASVLYDIGETEFQLQDYATSLQTMRRFLAETGPSAAHRAEVEATIETLSNRVGRLAIGVELAACEVAVDDQPVGTTPLAEPVLVSVGARKITVACRERAVASRRVDVSAGELQRVEVAIGPSLTPAPHIVASSAAHPSDRRTMHLALAWTATALLAAATLGVGTAALMESSQLGSLRQSYPASAAELERKGSLTHGLSIAADTLGVAALASLGISTWVTVRDRRERRARVTVGVTGVVGTF
jgi:hypothetical protein